MKELKIESPVELNNIDKLKSEAYDKIINDKIVNKFIKDKEIPLEFVSENLGLFLRMVEENEPCLHCKGYQFCKKVNLQKGYLTFVDANETVYYEKCKYYRAFLEKADLYLYRDFKDDKMFLNYNNENLIDPASRSMYATILTSILNRKNLYISSKENMDLLNDLVISAMNKTITNKKVAFINSTNLRDKIEYYNRNDEDKLYRLKDELFNCDILVIDSLGTEKGSELYKYSFLMDILTYRNSHNLMTIMTSYFNMEELEEVYGGYNLKNKTKILISKIKEYFDVKSFNTIIRR